MSTDISAHRTLEWPRTGDFLRGWVTLGSDAGMPAVWNGAREWHGETLREKNQEDGFWDQSFSFEAQSLHSQSNGNGNGRGFRQMLTAAAYMLETKLGEAELTDADVKKTGWGCLLDQNAKGGGLNTDIINLVCDMMQGLEAEPNDMVEVIVYWYFLLLSEDLPLCSLTWRPLAVTALLTAIKNTLPEQCDRFRNHIMCTISHWWPTDKLNSALEKFTARSQCCPTLFSASVYAKVFFGLRDIALRCEDPSTGSLNAECISTNENSNPVLHGAASRDTGVMAAFRHWRAGSENSLTISCSSSFHDESSDHSLQSPRRRSQRGNPQGTPHGSAHGGSRQRACAPAPASTKISL